MPVLFISTGKEHRNSMACERHKIAVELIAKIIYTGIALIDM